MDRSHYTCYPKILKKRFPITRRMMFRIGINLGDVIEEEDSIYGDGVNIAARLESLAVPGGICVSKIAFEQIEAKLPLCYEFLGEQTVKNIVKPVGAYKVVMAYIVLVSLYAYAGREDEARAAAGEIQRIAPKFSVEKFAKGSAWKEGPRRDRFLDSLRQAGVK